MEVIKRNGKIATFDSSKIYDAISAANRSVQQKWPKYSITDNQIQILTDRIVELIDNRNLGVEYIQDLVETALMEQNYFHVARAYIRYRYKKQLYHGFEQDFIDEIREKLGATNVQNQNANVDEKSFGGRSGEASGVMTKKLALEYIVSPRSRYNHENNIIYIHDLDNYYVGNHNCLSIPFDDLLFKGFNTRQTDVRPAGCVQTAFQLVAVIFQLQSLQQFGGVSATHLDWTMVPYVRKSFWKHFKNGLKYVENYNLDTALDRLNISDITNMSIEDNRYKLWPRAYDYAIQMLEEEINQATEAMYHNLNTLQSRSGN